MSAATVAMPAAADTKFWTVSAVIWVRWLSVDSPPWDCHFVVCLAIAGESDRASGLASVHLGEFSHDDLVRRVKEALA